MSGQNRWGIRRKLFCILLIILALNVAVLILMGSTLFERFYTQNKVSELKASARQLQDEYARNPDDLEAFSEQFNRVENRNSVIAVFSLDETGAPSIEYYTRERWKHGRRPDEDSETGAQGDASPDFSARFPEPPPLKLDEVLLEGIGQMGDEMRVNEGESFGGSHISLLARLDGSTFLYIETPKEYIRAIADLAVRYTAYLSAVILLVGAAGLYLLAGTVTKPIRKIQDVADKISRLDFTETCLVQSKDELGALSESINNMSRELQADIERLVEANAVLQNDLERQQKTDRMRRQFVANVSHDFKTPLTLIISYAEALPAARGDAERDEYRATIIEEGNRLSAMVGSLLKLSQLESGTVKIETSAFCLSEALESVVSSYKILAEKRGLHTRIQMSEDFIVEADFGKILQAAGNLYDNAIKYAPSGGRISVCAARDADGKCRVSVENTGSSIPPEMLESLFDSFFRADTARRRDDRSYGLGLAIVRAIMETHGESCGCENTPDGVRFWFTLKIADLGDGGGE